MANQCQNVITVVADDDNMALVKELFLNANREVDFNIIKPTPDMSGVITNESDGMSIATPSSNGWCTTNWGVRWNAADTMHLPDGSIYFNTAWTEPKAWFLSLIDAIDSNNLVADIKLTFGEGGCMFGGHIMSSSDGTVTTSVMTDAELNEFLGIEDETNNDIRERLAAVISSPEHLVVMDVAMGHVHDILFKYYGDSITFVSRNNAPITIMNKTEPDGVMISFYDADMYLDISSMGMSIINDIETNERLNDLTVSNIADTLSYVYQLMLDNKLEPSEYYSYE